MYGRCDDRSPLLGIAVFSIATCDSGMSDRSVISMSDVDLSAISYMMSCSTAGLNSLNLWYGPRFGTGPIK